MDQYIRRKEILDPKVCKGIECKDCPFAEGPLCRIRSYILHIAPSADVAEVRHGKWIDEGDMDFVCSECGLMATADFIDVHTGKPTMNFCPNCGAKNIEEAGRI